MKKAVAAVENPFMSNAFLVFDLPILFNLDEDQLDRRYLAAQAAVHPDAYVGRSEMEKRLAAQHAVTLNEAYQQLKGLQTRAQEFLKAKNISVPGGNGATVPASDLLMKVLEWRERIQAKEDLAALAQELKQRLENCQAQFDVVEAEKLPHCYLELTYTQKTLSELEMILKK